ncbi:MAG: 2-keto-4-pentenoate hydratase [Hyphomicrobiaceae bacterium]
MRESAKTMAASDMLYDCWMNERRIRELPPQLKPDDRAGGYAIQAHLEPRSSSPLFGWKIAATSAAGQAHIGVDGPLAGRLLAERVAQPGAIVRLGNNHMLVAEAEFAFRMGRTLAPRRTLYEVGDVIEAVDTLHPAIELPDSRFRDFVTAGAPQLIADNACARDFVLGEATTFDWRQVDLANHNVTGRVVGRYESEGKGANVLGDPRVALTWLANELSQQGIALMAGQIALTGTTTVPMQIRAGDEVIADLGALGSVSVKLR